MGKVKHKTKPKPQREDKTPVTLLTIEIKLNVDLTWLRRGKKNQFQTEEPTRQAEKLALLTAEE